MFEEAAHGSKRKALSMCQNPDVQQCVGFAGPRLLLMTKEAQFDRTHEFHLLIGRSAPMVSALRFLCNITLNFYAARLFKGENLGHNMVT